MSSVRDTLIQLMSRYSDDDESLLRDLNQLAEKEGNKVFPVFLNLLTHLDFSEQEARENWHALLQHRDGLSSSLNRPVKLLTAACDYFLTVKKSFSTPMVVESKIFEDAHHNSKCDPLTGLYNRNYFKEALSGEISRAKRQNSEFSLLFLDLDDFKQINDRLGHQAGDLALTQIAELINSEKRAEDIAVRYGGEELVVLLPNTNKLNALVKGERIRQRIEETTFNFENQKFHITASGGIASFPLDTRTAPELIACADKAMYKAKARGKNQILLYSSDQRQFIRVDFGGPVNVHELGPLATLEEFRGQSKDLSPSGMLFETEKALEIGSRVQLQIPIPTPEKPIVVIGTVVRVEDMGDKFDIGITFAQVESRDRDEITRYFQSLLDPQPFHA